MLEQVFRSLRQAQSRLAQETRAQKDAALRKVMEAIAQAQESIRAANEIDQAQAKQAGMSEALLDRLRLDEKRIAGIRDSIATVIDLPDPTGIVRSGWTLANGLVVEQVTMPLGVAAIIYESRPDVTVDAFSLAYKAGCSILLRGASSAVHSNRALVKAIKDGLKTGGGVVDALALADGGHDEVAEILAARGGIDVLIPRGGKHLIRSVVENAKVPVIETGAGNCHIYVEPDADMQMALAIIENAKVQKPGACNAVETLLVKEPAAHLLMPLLAARLAGTVELRCDKRSKEAIGIPPEGLNLKDAVEEDWETEYLDYILAVKVVDSFDQALEHINRYGTHHSEAIVTNNLQHAQKFCQQVDAACVYVNASTRFTDGGQFGFGAELGISTQKFHARGPMGLDALTTYRFRITGSGQTRPN
ncbi:MAG: glutamate-5-semialdehyde dehydrogenase [Spirochaetaceae bacterium]|jgi:glutamate-5-semialdehyde dehydrogenase|nr:glutamate-5-semialdehyde dehydrogenase [Spirochaetaceae bacterium]